MAHQSQPSRCGIPLGGVTNTYQRGDVIPPQQQEDSKALTNQRRRERYASLTKEQKDEINRKNRERRRKQEAENGNQRGVKNQIERERYANMSREKKDEINRKARERRMKMKALAIGKLECTLECLLIESSFLRKYVRSCIHSMIEKLKNGLSSKNIVQEYMCSNCELRYSALDAQYLVSSKDEYFHCERCSENLLPVDSESRNKDYLAKIHKLKEDLKPLSSSIEKLVGVAAPEVITLEQWTSSTYENANAVVEATNFIRSSTTVAMSNQGSRALKGSSQLNTLQPLRLKELPTWIIRDEGVNVKEQQRKTMNDYVLDVETTDNGKQED